MQDQDNTPTGFCSIIQDVKKKHRMDNLGRWTELLQMVRMEYFMSCVFEHKNGSEWSQDTLHENSDINALTPPSSQFCSIQTQSDQSSPMELRGEHRSTKAKSMQLAQKHRDSLHQHEDSFHSFTVKGHEGGSERPGSAVDSRERIWAAHHCLGPPLLPLLTLYPWTAPRLWPHAQPS